MVCLAYSSEGGEVCSAPTYEGVLVFSVPRDKIEEAGETSLDSIEAGG